MYLIYEIATGEPRMGVSSAVLAEANLGDGEAYIEIEDGSVNTNQILIVDGQVVPKERPAFDPIPFARHVRSGFLTDTDWTQVTDNSLTTETRQAWASYRQELRDFPATIAAIAANEELAGNVSTMHQVEELMPLPPDGG
jgi:hypothetical protein